MIRDAQHLFSDAQALTGSAASTNLIDLGEERRIGSGEPMCVEIAIDVAADGADGNETYVAQLQTDDNSGFSSATAIGEALTIARGTAAGARFYIPIPPDRATERYLRLNFTLGGTTPTVTLTASLIPQAFAQTERTYADALTVQ